MSCDLSWSQKHSGVRGQGSGCIRAEGAGLVLMALGGSRSKGGGGGGGAQVSDQKILDVTQYCLDLTCFTS